MCCSQAQTTLRPCACLTDARRARLTTDPRLPLDITCRTQWDVAADADADADLGVGVGVDEDEDVAVVVVVALGVELGEGEGEDVVAFADTF